MLRLAVISHVRKAPGVDQQLAYHKRSAITARVDRGYRRRAGSRFAAAAKKTSRTSKRGEPV